MDRILVRPLNSKTAFSYFEPGHEHNNMKRMDRIRKELEMAKRQKNAIIYLQRGRKAVEIARNVSLTQKTMFKCL
jgi:hypothetical protein